MRLRRGAVSLVARDENQCLRVIAMRERYAGVGRASCRRGDAWNHGEVDSGAGDGLELFPAAAEYERISALETHDALALACVKDQQLVDLALSRADAAGGLAHADFLGIAARGLSV